MRLQLASHFYLQQELLLSIYPLKYLLWPKLGIKFINTCNNLSSEFLIKVGGEKVTLQLPSNNAVLLLAPLIFIIFLQGLYYHLYLFYKSGNQCKES